MVIATDAGSNTFASLPPVKVLRDTPMEQLVPGTHRLDVDLEEDVTPRYVAQSLALQEASEGVFRHLSAEDRSNAEQIYDSQPSTDEGRIAKLRVLHSYRDLNTRLAADKVT